ncbi:hypothetical protein AWRI1631_142770 [Saccharomyces cerevisiae AWRI1631]|uniref:N2683 protein n=2 Tax=Saccharomyces cerevisiae TaxID=4932 RepID=E9P9Z8_YEASX|nr:putative ORF N2683 [Saccharomyces cerevisiae]EDZ69646.1 hypothetical protein AWRI1631_142770 [Saccharomyces cerevisiae AWRI1631]
MLPSLIFLGSLLEIVDKRRAVPLLLLEESRNDGLKLGRLSLSLLSEANLLDLGTFWSRWVCKGAGFRVTLSSITSALGFWVEASMGPSSPISLSCPLVPVKVKPSKERSPTSEGFSTIAVSFSSTPLSLSLLSSSISLLSGMKS